MFFLIKYQKSLKIDDFENESESEKSLINWKLNLIITFVCLSKAQSFPNVLWTSLLKFVFVFNLKEKTLKELLKFPSDFVLNPNKSFESLLSNVLHFSLSFSASFRAFELLLLLFSYYFSWEKNFKFFLRDWSISRLAFYIPSAPYTVLLLWGCLSNTSQKKQDKILNKHSPSPPWDVYPAKLFSEGKKY